MSQLEAVLLVAVGGAAGATLRHVLATTLDARWPRGTLVANVAGSALLGLLVGSGAGDPAYALLGVGFCGGLTTWSSYAVQTHRLGACGGAAYALGTLTPAVAACAAGFWLGRWMGQA